MVDIPRFQARAAAAASSQGWLLPFVTGTVQMCHTINSRFFFFFKLETGSSQIYDRKTFSFNINCEIMKIYHVKMRGEWNHVYLE